MHVCTARSKSSSVSCSLASPEPDRQRSAGSLLARPSTPHSTTRLCSRYSSSVISPSEKAWFRSRSRSMPSARRRRTNELRPAAARLRNLRHRGHIQRTTRWPTPWATNPMRDRRHRGDNCVRTSSCNAGVTFVDYHPARRAVSAGRPNSPQLRRAADDQTQRADPTGEQRGVQA